MRAASTACTVSGTAKPDGSWPNHQPPFWRARTPRSASIAISSSMKNGFPSARSASQLPNGARAVASQQRTDQLRPTAVDGRASMGAPVTPPPTGPSQAADRAVRAARSRSSAAARAPLSRRTCSRSHSSSDAQCRSSTRTAVGCSPVSSCRNPTHEAVQAVAYGQRVHRPRRREAEREAQPVAVSDPFSATSARVALQDPKVLLQHLTERPVRYPVAVREAPATSHQRLWRLPVQPLPELTQQPRLADSSVADNIGQVWFAAADDTAIGLLQVRQLTVPANEHRLQPADPARAHQRQPAYELAANDPGGLALGLDPRRAVNSNAPRTASYRPVTDQDLPRRGLRLEPRAQTLTASPVTKELPSRGRPTTTSPVFTPMRSLRRPPNSSLNRRRIPSAACSARSASSSCAAGAPKAAITASPTNFSTVPPACSISTHHRVVKTIQHRPDALGILLARKFGRPHKIGEQNSRDLPLLSWHTEILPRCQPVWPGSVTCQSQVADDCGGGATPGRPRSRRRRPRTDRESGWRLRSPQPPR